MSQCDAPAIACGKDVDGSLTDEIAIQNTGMDACSVATTGCSQEATFPPGAYTAIVRGVGGVTGVGLVGVDEITP